MRDPNRIDIIIDQLRDYWKQNPDLRLGQIVSSAACKAGWPHPDLFYVEDEQTLAGLRKLSNSPQE